MQLFEMQGLLAGKCLPCDMKVNETHAEYFLRKFNQVNELAAENSSLRLTIDNIVKALKLGDGPVSQQVIELVTGLTAENAEQNKRMQQLLGIINNADNLYCMCGDLFESHKGGGCGNPTGVLDYHYNAWLDAEKETPDTDAAIAELKAQGVDDFIAHCQRQLNTSIYAKSDRDKFEAGMNTAAPFALALRAGGKAS